MMNMFYRSAATLSRASKNQKSFLVPPKSSNYAILATQKEPTEPQILTSIPGPEAVLGIKQLTRVFDTRSVNMLIDYDKCFGN